MISIIIVTCDRSHLLRRCLTDVVARASDLVTEAIVWDNGSTDDTRAVIEEHGGPRVRAIHHPHNIGLNAYAEVMKHAKEPYVIELDDDIIDAPAEWDRRMYEVFTAVPRAGYIASNIVDDGHSIASNIFYRERADEFVPYTEAGVNLLRGHVGGYCTIFSRAVYDEVGGFKQMPGQLFFREDGEFVKAVVKAGYRATIAADVKVFHASGPYYSKSGQIEAAKAVFYRARDARRGRRNAVKRVLFGLPLFGPVNRRWLKLKPPPPRARAAGGGGGG